MNGIGTHKTFVRGVETFVITFLSAFISALIVSGEAVDLSKADSWSRIGTAFLTACGVMLRQWNATRGGTPAA